MLLATLGHQKYITVAALGVLVVATVLLGPRVAPVVLDRLAAFSLPVPFTTQAPTGKWDNNENCEEASAVMANAYLTGYTADVLTVSSTQESITTLIQWEQEHFGHTDNNSADEIAQMIEGVFHLKTAQLKNFTSDDLKHELLQHHVLILPISMKLLGNPEYPQNGQTYHVLVIRGFSLAGFRVNDPGLSDGKNNLYSFDTLYRAAADWDAVNHALIGDRKEVISVWQ